MGLLITISLIIFVVVVFMIKQRNKGKIRSSQLVGIHIISQLKSLISLVQQHRGLTSAWLNGDVKVEPKLMELKRSIQSISNLLHETSINSSERWIGFSDHWQRLLKLRNKPSVANSFEQHCLLVKNLAYLLEDTADNYFLTADYFNDLPNIGFTWRELIVSAENIGQSRAIGTGVSAQKYCSSVDKIRLNFLTETMNNVTLETLSHLSFLPNESAKHKQLVSAATLKIEQLIKTITQELVNTNSISINHQQYFTLASSTMQCFEEIFDHQIKQLAKTI
jgi:hypothetical protein